MARALMGGEMGTDEYEGEREIERMPTAADNGMVNLPSDRSVDEIVDVLTRALQAHAIKLFAIVDHDGEADNVGITMRPRTPQAKCGCRTTVHTICRNGTASRQRWCRTWPPSSCWPRRRRGSAVAINSVFAKTAGRAAHLLSRDREGRPHSSYASLVLCAFSR